MDPKLLMKTGKQLCEIGAALLSSCEGMEDEKEEGNEEGLLNSSDESAEDEMPEAEESEEPEDDDKEKRIRLAKAKLRKGK